MKGNYAKPVVIDNGTGFTKMGYSGNLDPDFVFPTCISDMITKSNVSVSRAKYDDYNFYIGDAGLEHARNNLNTHQVTYPMRSGIVEDWDVMEKFWHQSLYNYLKCDPQEHPIILTEPPMNPPENRENVAEIFFETFNVPALYIGVQAVFALIGCNKTNTVDTSSKKKKNEDQMAAINSLTGIVIDSGDGVTHVVPVCDGYVLGSSIKHIPIAGRDITKFMMNMIKERNEEIDNQDLYYVAMEIKEKHGYLCKDIVEEFAKWDEKIVDDVTKKYSLGHKFKQFNTTGRMTQKPISMDLGYEAFLGPESFFAPEIIDKNYTVSIDQLVDDVIMKCPVDYRRKLYSNMVLSGGSTMFKNFDRRLQRQISFRVDERLDSYFKQSGTKPKPIQCSVTSNIAQQHSVWLGGSAFSAMPNFNNVVHTREEYAEKGPGCCRFNPVFGF